ncbi:hypothetical protein Tco_1018611 [Tanacetum coccineum]|uniref:Zinc knuckle CX2CX4HX4C n=1 Tax=Tanacetum coccineum TaxID=301880 RepID=A0ABQ5FUR7_9ASTR
MESRGETIVGEDSIQGIVNSFSKVIDGMNKSNTNHVARVDPKHDVYANPKGAAFCMCYVDPVVGDDTLDMFSEVIRTHGNDAIAEFFNVTLTTPKEIDDFNKDLELGKYVVWSELTSDKRKKVLDNITTRWNAIVAEVSHVDPIVESIFVQDKPSSYVAAVGGTPSEPCAAGGSKPKPNKSKANFCSLPPENLCEGAKFSIPRKVVETASTRFTNTLYGYFIGKRIAFPVVEYYVFSEDGLSIIASQIVPLIEGSRFNIETVTIKYEWKPPRCDLCKIFGHVHDHCPKKVSVPTNVTPNVVKPAVEKINDGFQTVRKKKKKGKSKSTNLFSGPSVKQTLRYEPKKTTSAPKKGDTNLGNSSKSASLLKNQPLKATVPATKEGNITKSNSYAALDDETDEDVVNVYDESANLFHTIKTSGSSSTFTVAAG